MEAKRRKCKRVVVVADLHCGHRVGLTPPQWQLNPENPHDAKWQKYQSDQWEWYCCTIDRLKPIDLLLVLGDCVDGVSSKAESRDSIRIKRVEQIDMAMTALGRAKASKIEMVYGTRYHCRDWEDDVASALDAKIGAHGWPEVTCANGPSLIFDIKHHIGASTIPHGRATAVKRAQLWNTLWSEAGKQPKADILLRGHVHYHEGTFRIRNGRLQMAMTCPALQGMGSEYGAERCEGLVDFGLLHFDVYSDGRWAWQAHIGDLESQKARTSPY